MSAIALVDDGVRSRFIAQKVAYKQNPTGFDFRESAICASLYSQRYRIALHQKGLVADEFWCSFCAGLLSRGIEKRELWGVRG